MKKNLLLCSIAAAVTLTIVGMFTGGGSLIHSVSGNTDSTWKHYAAVMPTADKQGIREYWTSCSGDEPVFTNPGVPSTDEFLTDAQLNAILANKKDARIIPTLTDIQIGVNKGFTGNTQFEGSCIYNAYGYNFLDAETKLSITNVNETLINFAKKNYENWFSLNQYVDIFKTFGSFETTKCLDDTYGEYMSLKSTIESGGNWSYGDFSFGETSAKTINLAIYVDQPTDIELVSRGNSYVFYDFSNKKLETSEKKLTLTAKQWNLINLDVALLKEMREIKEISLAIYCTNDEAYGVRTTGEPAKITGLYETKDNNLASSIMNASFDLGGTGARSTWGTMSASFSYDIDATYGPVRTFTVTSVGEVMQFLFNNTLAVNYDYIEVSIYAPRANSDLFIQSNNWSQGVIYPKGTFANILSDNTGYLAQGWNTIRIPAADFAAAKYFAIVDTKNKAQVNEVYKMTNFVGKYYDYTNVINEINALPAPENAKAFDYTAIYKIAKQLEVFTDLSPITNIEKYNTFKSAWEAKYYVIYNPLTGTLPSGGGNAGCSVTFTPVIDDEYGICLKIDATHTGDGTYFQYYFYTTWGTLNSMNDKIHVGFVTPFDAGANTSQSAWYGPDATRHVFALTKNTLVDFNSTMAVINSGVTTTTLNASFQLQRYGGAGTVARGDYAGTYYMTAIYGEVVA